MKLTQGTLRIRSGGQTGVDRAALDFALQHGLACAGWCPRGGLAEDLPEPPGLLQAYPFLVATPSRDPSQRSAWNVRDGDATWLVTSGSTTAASPGTRWTERCAEAEGKPLHRVDLASDTAAVAAARWLASACAAHAGSVFDLNVAGPRESEAPGIYARTRGFLDEVWRLRRDPPGGRGTPAR